MRAESAHHLDLRLAYYRKLVSFYDGILRPLGFRPMCFTLHRIILDRVEATMQSSSWTLTASTWKSFTGTYSTLRRKDGTFEPQVPCRCQGNA